MEYYAIFPMIFKKQLLSLRIISIFCNEAQSEQSFPLLICTLLPRNNIYERGYQQTESCAR